jgi:hypothetical protein
MMSRSLERKVTLPLLSVHGALTLGKQLLAAAEPLESHPSFLAIALLRLDDALRTLRGLVQYRNQLLGQRPSRQQKLRADVNVHAAVDETLAAMRAYLTRVAAIADENEPETTELSRALFAPAAAWETRYGEHIGATARLRQLAVA